MTQATTSNTPAALASLRQKRFHENAKKKGLKRMPAGYLAPDVSEMIQELIAKGYAPSIGAVLHRAVREKHAEELKEKQ